MLKDAFLSSQVHPTTQRATVSCNRQLKHRSSPDFLYPVKLDCYLNNEYHVIPVGNTNSGKGVD